MQQANMLACQFILFFIAPVQFNISRIEKEPQKVSKIRDFICHAAKITWARMVGSWWLC